MPLRILALYPKSAPPIPFAITKTRKEHTDIPPSTTSRFDWYIWLITVWRCVERTKNQRQHRHPTQSHTHMPIPLLGNIEMAHLQHLQLLQPLLHQLLDPARVVDAPVVAERIPRAALGVFPEVVGVELVALAEELSVLW